MTLHSPAEWAGGREEVLKYSMSNGYGGGQADDVAEYSGECTSDQWLN